MSKTEERIARGLFTHILTVNPLILEAARADSAAAAAFGAADFCVPESAGIAFVARVKGWPLRERIAGIDLMMELCRLAAEKGWPVALYGGKPGVAEAAAANLQSRFPGLKISGALHGFGKPAEESRAAEELALGSPKLLFAGLGVPKQEKWIFENKPRFPGAAAVGIGGSMDVISGSLARAPDWMRRAGLEWAFRGLQEPWRAARILRTAKAVFLALRSRCKIT